MTCWTRALFARLLLLLLVVAAAAPASAQETITYTYDAMGRLVTVNHGTTGPNANVSSTYTYDAANNRTKVVVTAPITLTLTPPPLANGTVGAAYSQTIVASGGTSPYTYQKTSGSMPAGLTLSTGGVLSGTPTTIGTSTFTVTATDSASNTGSQSYSVTIAAAPTITLSSSLPAGTYGATYSSTITASGGTSPYTYQATSGTLPSGLTLSSAGVLSGTPSAAGTYAFTVTATDSSGYTGSQAYSVAIALGITPTTLANGTVGTAYPSTNIVAAGGTSPYSYTISAGALPSGMQLNSAGALSGTPASAGTYTFTVGATDSASNSGSQAYTLTITGIALSPTTLTAGTVGTAYSKTITASGGTAPYTYAVTSGTLPSGLSLSTAGVLSGTPSAAGTSTFTVTATDNLGNSGSQSYSLKINPLTLTVSPSTLPSGTVDTLYSQTITATKGTAPYTFTSSGTLPTAVTLSSSGVLSGTPSTAGRYNFSVTATDTVGNTGSQSYTVTIAPVPVLTISPSTLPNGKVSTSYSQTITATGGTGTGYKFSIVSGSLPAGMNLSLTGILSGRPINSGSYSFTIGATDSANNTGNQAYTLNISS
jgi:hypothetical protein